MNLRIIPSITARPRNAGFSLVEIAVSLFVFGMITLLFGAVFPMASRVGHAGSNYAEAALIGQRKIDQCRQADYAGIYGTGNILATLGMIDKTQPAGYPSSSGGKTTYSFTTADSLVDSGTVKGFFPPGTTGTLSVGPVPSGSGWTAPSVSQAVLVTATIHWVGGPQGDGTYTTSTIIHSH